MRVIHLCFRLGMPVVESLQDWRELGEDCSKRERFQRYNQAIVQPFLALLERNMQRDGRLHVSLVATGEFWEQAERYDQEILARFGKLMKKGQIELIAVPYYRSWSFFYDRPEFAEQVDLYRRRSERWFGVKSQVLSGTSLVYDDAMAQWAEKHEFAVMLAAVSQKDLGWRSPNRVYEAEGCQYLRVLFGNEKFTKMLERTDSCLLTSEPPKDGEEMRDSVSCPKISFAKFRKELELEYLRGNLVNIFLDATIFGRLRDLGIVSFFDEMLRFFRNDSDYRFVCASEACVFETPSSSVSIKQAEGGEFIDEEKSEDRTLMLCDQEEKIPQWLQGEKRGAAIKLLKELRREIEDHGTSEQKEKYRHLATTESLDSESSAAKLMIELEGLRSELTLLENESEVGVSTFEALEVKQPILSVDDVESSPDSVAVSFVPRDETKDRATKASLEEDNSAKAFPKDTAQVGTSSREVDMGAAEDFEVQVKIVPRRAKRAPSRQAAVDEKLEADNSVVVHFVKKKPYSSTADENQIHVNFVRNTSPTVEDCSKVKRVIVPASSQRVKCMERKYDNLQEAQIVKTGCTELLPDDPAIAFVPLEVPTLRVKASHSSRSLTGEIEEGDSREENRKKDKTSGLTRVRRKIVRRSLVIE